MNAEGRKLLAEAVPKDSEAYRDVVSAYKADSEGEDARVGIIGFMDQNDGKVPRIVAKAFSVVYDKETGEYRRAKGGEQGVGFDGHTSTMEAYKTDGEYTPERKVLHAEIIKKVVNGYTDKNGRVHPGFSKPEGRRPRIIFMGGGSGSGKSSLTKRMREQGLDLPIIDPDEIMMEMIPEYPMLAEQNTLTSAYLAHDEASELSMALFRICIEKGYDFIMDGTFSNPDRVAMFQRMVDESGHEYSKHLRGMTIDVGQAMQSCKDRYVKTQRFVPMDVAEKSNRGFEGVAHDESLMDWFDGVEIYRRDGDSITAVMERKDGKTEIKDEGKWEVDKMKKDNTRMSETGKTKKSTKYAGGTSNAPKSNKSEVSKWSSVRADSEDRAINDIHDGIEDLLGDLKGCDVLPRISRIRDTWLNEFGESKMSSLMDDMYETYYRFQGAGESARNEAQRLYDGVEKNMTGKTKKSTVSKSVNDLYFEAGDLLSKAIESVSALINKLSEISSEDFDGSGYAYMLADKGYHIRGQLKSMKDSEEWKEMRGGENRWLDDAMYGDAESIGKAKKSNLKKGTSATDLNEYMVMDMCHHRVEEICQSMIVQEYAHKLEDVMVDWTEGVGDISVPEMIQNVSSKIYDIIRDVGDIAYTIYEFKEGAATWSPTMDAWTRKSKTSKSDRTYEANTPEILQYLEPYFAQDSPVQLMSEAGGDADRASREWASWWFRENGQNSERNVEELREVLDMSVDEITAFVRQWFQEEYDDYLKEMDDEGMEKSEKTRKSKVSKTVEKEPVPVAISNPQELFKACWEYQTDNNRNGLDEQEISKIAGGADIIPMLKGYTSRGMVTRISSAEGAIYRFNGNMMKRA